MRFNPKARLDTGRVSDSGGRGGGGTGGGPMRIPIPGGSKAGGGMGALILLIVLILLNQCGGVSLPGGGGSAAPGGGGAFDTQRVAQEDSGRYDNCKTGDDANSDPDCARIAVENSLYNFWSADFEKDNQQFQPATMQTFTGAVSTACGQATSQVGPFYCPGDQRIYLDTTFFDDVLEQQLGGPDGGFVEPYVLAHEYGHHIQNIAGIMNRVRTQQGPNSDAVKLELQADCFAGTWAADADGTTDKTGNQPIFQEITQQDIKLAIEAAAAVGDDRIQQKTQGRVNPDAWTHGSAEQRMQAFQVGYRGTPNDCLKVGP